MPAGIAPKISTSSRNIASAGRADAARSAAQHGVFEFLPDTADFLYLRLLGDYSTKYDPDGQQMHRYGKLLWKREAALDSWALKVERHLGETRSVWAFVNNHFEGFSPETCQRLANRLGFELPLASAEETISSSDPRPNGFVRVGAIDPIAGDRRPPQAAGSIAPT